MLPKIPREDLIVLLDAGDPRDLSVHIQHQVDQCITGDITQATYWFYDYQFTWKDYRCSARKYQDGNGYNEVSVGGIDLNTVEIDDKEFCRMVLRYLFRRYQKVKLRTRSGYSPIDFEVVKPLVMKGLEDKPVTTFGENTIP